MPTKASINGIHAQRLKQIRRYIDFDFDLRKPLTPYQKRKIKTYYDEIDALTARPYQVYRPKTKDHLKKAQEFAQHEKRLPGLKVAFIPTDGRKQRIRFDKNNEISISSKHVITRVIEINPLLLIDEPSEYIRDLIADRVENSYTVLCGRYEIPVGLTKRTLPNYVARLTTKYANTENNNYFGNWLHGIAAHHFTEQAEFSEYLKAKTDAKTKHRKARRAKKERQRRAKRKAR